MNKVLFGKTSKGEEVYLYELSNSKGMKAKVMNLGANLVELHVPDKNGEVADVCLGFDNVADYEVNSSFFGAVIGPSANRIADASFEIDGVKYDIPVNDGKNNLHSDIPGGVHKRIWDVKEGDNCITFTIKSADMDMGFPGNKVMSITYVLTENNEIKLQYKATSDKKTVMNLTNHAYFNLSGADCGKNIEDHILTLNAANYTPVVAGAIPTGEIAPVAGTVMDFTSPKAVGKEINADFEQLKLTLGYDHNFVCDNYTKGMREIAKVEDPKSGRVMKVASNLPGVQFYAGNCISPCTGKLGAHYDKRSGLCLETQYYPDSIHQPGFPSCVFGPGNDYESETVYSFENK
ncbi:MAG: galactose mutarotase [Lachnospiraceae bacterium]|nr:galactose mutarotase [Lachnospiraceae bacterium]